MISCYYMGLESPGPAEGAQARVILSGYISSGIGDTRERMELKIEAK